MENRQRKINRGGRSPQQRRKEEGEVSQVVDDPNDSVFEKAGIEID